MLIRRRLATVLVMVSAMLSLLIVTSTRLSGHSFKITRMQEIASDGPARARGLDDQGNQGVVVVRNNESRGDFLHPIQLYPLVTGGVLRHEQYEGVVRRIDATGGEVARAKVPVTSRHHNFRTELVLSRDHSRVLAIYTDSDERVYRAKHRMLLMETSSLRTIHTLKLGNCSSVTFTLAVSADALTLLCQHSQNPHQRSVKPTLALVTLDVREGRVTRWFALGGARRLSLPGYYYEVKTLEVRTVTTRACPELNPPVRLFQDVGAAETAPPDMVFVLSRGGANPPTWEVWGVSVNETEMPRRIVVLSGTIGPRVGIPPDLCGDVGSPSSASRPPRFLYVTMNRPAPAQLPDQVGGFRDARGFDIVVIDVGTGRIITPSVNRP